MAPAYASICSTFAASIRSVGTAVSMAAVGVYLHRRGFVDGPGKKTLALISQQVTFPLFLFTKIIYCNQDWSTDPCPNVTESLEDVWMLLFWPIVVVGIGVLVGWVVAKATGAPKKHTRSILAACAFGNSTGLPITLLTVVHSNFPATSDLGRIDPTLFLSIYLLFYPVLQWGLGGWMLADDDRPLEEDGIIQTATEATGLVSDAKSSTHRRRPSVTETLRSSFRQNVLNNKTTSAYYNDVRRGLSSSDEGLYMSEFDLQKLEQAAINGAKATATPSNTPAKLSYQPASVISDESERKSFDASERSELSERSVHDGASVWVTVENILSRCLQPPVVGTLAGIICAVTPLRGIFVDIIDRSSDAPLQWLFDGLHSVGTAAVPINMIILGCNLSSSFSKKAETPEVQTSGLLSNKAMVGIVIGKMLVMPLIGVVLCMTLQRYFWHIPDEIDGAFWLVAMIVFLTPTANNVMVIVELSGSGAKEGIARVIAMQYAVAPIILSVTMTIAVGLASHWS